VNALNRLHQAVAAVAPIDGVSIGNLSNRSTWVVSYQTGATPAQRTAGQNVINTFDPTAPTAEETRIGNLRNDPTATELKNTLLGATPAQIDAYVNSQGNDLPSTRALLKKMLLLTAVSLAE
jgi:hypothetical protein